ncbi:MAG: radical SAM protein [Candidatus Moraniibacteriota bacterium]
MQSITRKSSLYKSKVNYGDYAINHANGCSHGCTYCYEMLGKINKKKIKDCDEWVEPKIVKNTLELLDKEIPKIKNKIKVVHLCFATDPFMYGQDEVEEMTLKIINRLNKDGIRCTVLTKGILPKELADKSYSLKNEYGITLVSLDPKFHKIYEPGASPINERFEALKYLHKQGLKTWVSLEPYPTPSIIQQDFLELLEKVKFADKIIFGSWNYNSQVSEYKDRKKFYLECVNTLRKFCEENGIKYHIKIKGLEFEEFKNTEIFK